MFSNLLWIFISQKSKNPRPSSFIPKIYIHAYMLSFFRITNLRTLLRAELINKQQLLILQQFSIFHYFIRYIFFFLWLIFGQSYHFIGTCWKLIIIFFFQIFLKHIRESHILLLHFLIMLRSIAFISFR